MVKLIRFVLGKLILFLDLAFPVSALKRPPELQAPIDTETRRLAIYQFEACPFCVKVRRGIKRLGLDIELRDARNNPKFKEELIKGGGQYQVPCLRVMNADGSATWMYESSDILAYLEKRYG